jgi:cell division septal protein FtsQ
MRGGKPPRRRKPSLTARVRPFWVPIILVAAVIAAALVAAAMWPGFYPRRIVVSGNSQVSRPEILARAHVSPNRSIWLQNTGAMRRRIEAIPEIATASILPMPSGVLRIRVTERRPFAILRNRAESVVVDRALRVLMPTSGDESLPEFTVEGSAELTPGEFVATTSTLALRDAYDAMAARHITPAGLSFDRYGGLVVTLRNGLRVLIGQQNDLAQKLTLVDAILMQVVRSQRRIAAIDVRAPGTPVVVYR